MPSIPERTEMPETAKDMQAIVDQLAADAFATHQLEAKRPGLWKCARERSWIYGFFVSTMPGAIAIYGDTDDALFRVHDVRNDQQAVEWLRGAVGSPSYLFSKVVNRDAYREFYPDDALAFARTLAGDDDPPRAAVDFLDDVVAEAAAGELNAHTWAQHLHDHAIDDAWSVGTDWSSSAWWVLHALRTFIRLHDASATTAAATDAPTPADLSPAQVVA